MIIFKFRIKSRLFSNISDLIKGIGIFCLVFISCKSYSNPGSRSSLNASDDIKYYLSKMNILLYENDTSYFGRTIVGTVLDKDNHPIPGITVVEKGTNNATISDDDGKFNINLTTKSPTLIFTGIGYKEEQIKVSDQEQITIVLKRSLASLDEVVVVGYGAVKKSDLTGSVASISSSDFNKGAVNSLQDALQGRVSGVQINKTNAEPGGGISIRIRGVNSITAGTTPLYVIDGLPIDNASMFSGGGAAGIPGNNNPTNPLNSLNPNDIKSIEILKDASATAIYGSRGANGVVLITTKNGSEGKLAVNLNLELGVQSIYKQLDILSTQEYMKSMNEIQMARDGTKFFSDAEMKDIGSGTNWPEVVTRSAITSNVNISMRGGSSKTHYYMSANHVNQQGIVRGSGFKRYSFRINLTQDIGEKLKVGTRLTNAYVKFDHDIEGGSGNTQFGPYYAATVFDPTLPVYQDDGSLTYSDKLTLSNPVYLYKGKLSETDKNQLMGNLFLKYSFSPNLDGKFMVGINRNTGRQDLYSKKVPISVGSILSSADIINKERYSHLFQYTMTYDNKWGDLFGLNVLGGVTFEGFHNRSFGVGTTDFPTDVTLTNNLGLGDVSNATMGSNKEEHSLLSFLGRANFTFLNKFLLTTSFRADGSSRFGKNNKFGYFPSFAFAYKLSEEDFIPNSIDELKLRASWGVTGNQAIGNYAAISLYGRGAKALFGGETYQGAVATKIANPDLKWESTYQLDFGADITVLDGRLSGTLDYFLKNTRNMLMNLPIPHSTGFGSVLRNVGSMQNEGFEVSLNSRNIENRDFKWITSLNFSTLKNKVTDIGPLDRILTGNFFTNTYGIIKPGLPINEYYGYKVTGIFKNKDEVANSAQPNSQPGNPIYLDANSDGKITPEDRVVLGNPWPDYTFGIKNHLSFKDWYLDIYISAQEGADLLNGNIIYSMYPAGTRMNRMRDMIINRWTPDNPDAKWPSAVNPASYGGSKVNSLAIEDASFFKVQSVQLGYDFHIDNMVHWIKSCRLYITGQNLLIVTNYSGLNPETNKNGQGSLRADRNPYPMARAFLVGLNVEF